MLYKDIEILQNFLKNNFNIINMNIDEKINLSISMKKLQNLKIKFLV